jgi:hypothetical protein
MLASGQAGTGQQVASSRIAPGGLYHDTNPDSPDHKKLLHWPEGLVETPGSTGWRYGKTLIVMLAVWTKVVDTVSRGRLDVIMKGDLPCTTTAPIF